MARRNSGNVKSGRKSSVGIVILFELLLGILVGVGSFGLSYRYLSEEESASEMNVEEEFDANDVLEKAQANLTGSDIDAVVKSIDTENSTVEFLNLRNNSTTVVNVTSTSAFPKGTNISTLETGDILTYVFDANKNLVEVKKCENEWTLQDTGVAINTTSQLVKFTDASTTSGDVSYKYVEGLTTVRYNNEIKSLANISPYDYVELHGYDNGKTNKVYNIQIIKSHGNLNFSNAGKIENMQVSVNSQPFNLNDSTQFTLTEGVYTIEITGSNISPITKEVSVSPVAVADVDLSQIQMRKGLLSIRSNVEGYRLKINGTDTPYVEPILLEYGTYNIVATMPDYKDIVQAVTIDADNNPLELKFVKVQETGSVSVKAQPDTADIFINDIWVGEGSTKQTLALGTYLVKCQKDGYKTQIKQINISVDGQNIDLAFALESDGSATAPTESEQSE